MATPKKEPIAETPGYVKTADVAALLELTPQWIRDLTKQGILKKYKLPVGERYNLIESTKAYVRYLREKLTSKEAKASPWEEMRAKGEAELKQSKASMAEIQLHELEGKMHRSDDVEAMTTDLVYAIRSMIVALPGRLAMDVTKIKTAPEASERIQQEAHQILRELAAYQYDPEKYKQRVRDREGWQAEDGPEE